MRERIAALVVLMFVGAAGARAQAPVPGQIDRLRDRGPGIATDMFGTYVVAGELIVYPFFEYYRDRNYEYEPAELGFGPPIEFRGRYRASEGLIYLGYGVSDRIALEFEMAAISATLHKADDDASAVPTPFKESGLGDTAARVRWRWNRESDERPEFFSVFEVGFPLQRSRRLIGTQSWEFGFITGMIRGYSWGTVTLRAAIGSEAGAVEGGEYAVEYLRRVSPHLRVYAAVEGTQDEVEAIGELQVFLTPRIFLKINNAFGVTSKAADWAPEVGVVFTFGRR
jgi:hypothetical protein